MSFFEALLSGSNAKERSAKKACVIAIAVTAVLLAVALIALLICQIAGVSASNTPEDEPETLDEAIKLGETKTIELSDTAIFTGNLLTLNDNNPYKGTPTLENIEERRSESKPKAFISLFDKKDDFEATAETANSLFAMVNDCNAALNDDNLVLTNAYNVNSVSSQKAVYSSGEVIALSYCHEGSTKDIRPIGENPKYDWIYKNAYKYGFAPLTPKSNEFRYVGVTHATAIKNKGLSIDNYLKQLRSATAEAPIKLNVNGSYVAYFCPINNVVIPKNATEDAYQMSGDNLSGVIVTVNMSKIGGIAE